MNKVFRFALRSSKFRALYSKFFHPEYIPELAVGCWDNGVRHCLGRNEWDLETSICVYQTRGCASRTEVNSMAQLSRTLADYFVSYQFGVLYKSQFSNGFVKVKELCDQLDVPLTSLYCVAVPFSDWDETDEWFSDKPNLINKYGNYPFHYKIYLQLDEVKMTAAKLLM